MRRSPLITLLCAAALALSGAPAHAGGGSQEPPSTTTADRLEKLQQELDSLIEEVDDLREPVAEFDLFDECMYVIGVTEQGRGSPPSPQPPPSLDTPSPGAVDLPDS